MSTDFTVHVRGFASSMYVHHMYACTGHNELVPLEPELEMNDHELSECWK